MDRVNKILKNSQFKDYLSKNKIEEKDRLFCKHDMRHIIDVARVAYILSLEKELHIKKDIIYATALLHDIGRWKEYQNKEKDHAKESADLSKEILQKCDYNKEEIELITDAISNHREKDHHNSTLSEILYQSDKLCRPCYECEAIKECKRFKDNKEPYLEY